VKAYAQPSGSLRPSARSKAGQARIPDPLPEAIVGLDLRLRTERFVCSKLVSTFEVRLRLAETPVPYLTISFNPATDE
jgi:hypothetical protein